MKTAAGAFSDSISIIEPLVRKILDKEMVIALSTKQAVEFKKSACLLANENMIKSSQSNILKELPDTLKRLTLLNSEKNASIWLTTLPLQSRGYYLNKECFRDALCMRYGWRIPNMAGVFVCGQKNLEHNEPRSDLPERGIRNQKR